MSLPHYYQEQQDNKSTLKEKQFTQYSRDGVDQICGLRLLMACVLHVAQS